MADCTAEAQSTGIKTIFLCSCLHHSHAAVDLSRDQSSEAGKLQWKIGADIIIGVTERTQAAVINGQVYIGGGGLNTASITVSQYNPDTDTWTKLPEPGVEYFALCAFQGTLLTVGGEDENGATGKVLQYQATEKKWVEYITPMPTARGILSALTTQSAIVACGGITVLDRAKGIVEDSPVTDVVEVYSTDTKQWHKADPLPVPYLLMSSTVFNDNGYLLGGLEYPIPSKKVFQANLPSLISKAIRGDTGSESAWKTLPEMPLYAATAANLNGALVAVGGILDSQVSASLYSYHPAVNNWLKVYEGDMPGGLFYGTAANFNEKKLFVCGGRNTVATYIGNST